MCGRFTLTATPEEIRAIFRYAELPNFPPRYNIAPTQPIATVVRGPDGGRHFLLVRWGLIPGWVKDPASFTLLINARSETAAEKPAFRAAFRHRRALIPASGFYEWRREPTGRKTPYLIRPRDGGVVAFAGLQETWSSADGSEMDTGAILTTAANATLAPIHDRMPAVIAPEDFERWLDPVGTSPAEAAAMLEPAPSDLFEAIPVSDRVNAVRNDDAGLQTPAGPAEPVVPAPRRRSRAGGSDPGGQMSFF